MSKEKNYFTRQDGIAEIFPVYPENISHRSPSPYNPQVNHDMPFTLASEESAYCIRDAIAICNPVDNNIVEGVVVFEIRPDNWAMICVPTEKLCGFRFVQGDDGTKLNEFDYLWTPIECIHGSFFNHIESIRSACVDYMNEHPELSADVVDAIEETIHDLHYALSTDFTVDIYIPPRICDLTGEIYLRPGGQLYSIFDNPHRDADFEPPRQLKEFLHDVIVNEMSAKGLTLACDLFFSFENKMLADEAKKEQDRKILAEKMSELSKVFKTYQYPPIDTSAPKRELAERPIPQGRPAMRSDIIPESYKWVW